MYGDLSRYDIFNSRLLCGAEYAGALELPVLRPATAVPEKLVSFSHARASREELAGVHVHFFEHDCKFQCIWNNPGRYLPLLRRCSGVIGPDFSMYRNMPAAMQQWNCFRGRAVAYWLQQSGVDVVPNVRFSDDRSWAYCFDGLPARSILAVGSHGCLRLREDRRWFEAGLYELFCRLSPQVLVVYGATPEAVFGPYREAGVGIVGFQSAFATAHSKGATCGDR